MRTWHWLPLSLGLLLPAACGTASATTARHCPPSRCSYSRSSPPASPVRSICRRRPGLAPLHRRAAGADSRRAGRRAANDAVPRHLEPRHCPRRSGLLSFAFHPQYSTNGFVYVHFIENIPNTTGDIVVERYQVSSNPNVLQTPGTE